MYPNLSQKDRLPMEPLDCGPSRHYYKAVSTALVRRIQGWISAGLLLLLSAMIVPAQGPNSTWYERSWESADGLPDNDISGAAQTPDGFLWLATAGGLLRFDGVHFQEFPLVNFKGIPNRVVRAMLLDREGRLWLGMDRGPIVCISPGATKVWTNAPDARATYMAQDGDGGIWITYADGGLTGIKNGRVRVFNKAQGWPEAGVSSIASDVAGRLWFAKGRRVGILQLGKFQTLFTARDTVWCIGQRREGGIWICAGRQLMFYDGSGRARQFGELPAEVPAIEATTAFEDKTGAVWIGTAANGLFRCDGTNTIRVPTSYNEIVCVMEDRESNIWVGTGGGGLDRVRPRIIELLGTASGLPDESVRSVCGSASGAVWVTTQNGLLARWYQNAWSVLPMGGTNRPSGFVSCVASDAHGGLWIGTRDRGLYHLNLANGKCRNWRQGDGLCSDDVRCILDTTNGDVYIASDIPSRQQFPAESWDSFRGAVVSSGFGTRLQRLRDGRFQSLTMSIQPRSIRALTEDAEGRIWAGSADGRLLLVEGDQLLDETPGATNRLLSIRCLYATPDGSLWIGYAGWGIGWLKNGKYARITSDQGLYDDYISQMVSDGMGWLWCAGNRGIFEVSLEQLRKVARGQYSQLRSIAYSEDYPNLQPNYENVPGAFRSQDGRLWFPMHTGLAAVYPDHVPVNAPPPPMLLERVVMDGQTVAQYSRYVSFETEHVQSLDEIQGTEPVLRLPPSLRKLDFEFAALSFSVPENVEFQYRLEGLDTNWVEGGTARKVTYSQLQPGRYRFQVRACNLAGVWNKQDAMLRFVVLPFYWQTWWFRLSALLLFTLCIAAIVRYVSFRRLHLRLRALEQQAALQRERARIAKDIHDDLGANLTQIAYLGELAHQDQAEPDKAAIRIEKISTTARQAVKSLDEIVWAVNPRNDTLSHLIDYAGQFALDYLRTSGIRCRLDLPEQSPIRELSTDLRHNLFLVIKEALHNIVKHSRAREVKLRATFNDQGLDMVIEDDGCGFDQMPDDAFADGLRNMRQRMNDIGGECRFDSQSGQGTRVMLHLPWPVETRNGG